MSVRFLVAALLLIAATAAQAAITVSAARIWPAEEYTRITLESDKPLAHEMIMLKNPDRLVLDLEDVDLGQALKSISDNIHASDPYIQQIRTGYFKPGVVRVVVDLKTQVKPQIFSLEPIGEYKHRLVLDIYPLQDPLMAMLNQMTKDKTGGEGGAKLPEPESNTAILLDNDKLPLPDEPGKDPKTRVITIAIDAGHGGEDPGARGATGSHEKDITLAIAKKLKAAVDAEPNMRGVLTRDGDYFIPLHGRVVKARKLRADLFVSIHADAFTRPSARGSSVFALSESGATSASALPCSNRPTGPRSSLRPPSSAIRARRKNSPILAIRKNSPARFLPASSTISPAIRRWPSRGSRRRNDEENLAFTDGTGSLNPGH